MKGIIKYNQKFYKKSSKPIKKGDLIKLECKRSSDYFKYNGIYTVVSNFKEIHIKKEGEVTLCLKLGYNVFEYSKLVLVKRKKSLPSPVKEEQEY